MYVSKHMFHTSHSSIDGSTAELAVLEFAELEHISQPKSTLGLFTVLYDKNKLEHLCELNLTRGIYSVAQLINVHVLLGLI